MRPGRHIWHAMPSGRRPNKVKTHMLKDCSLPSLLVPINPNESDFTATKGALCAFCEALWTHNVLENACGTVPAWHSILHCPALACMITFIASYGAPLNEGRPVMACWIRTACLQEAGPTPAQAGATHLCVTIDTSVRRVFNQLACGGAAVIVTVGPACQDVETLCKLLDAGATCARVDLTVRTIRALEC